MDYEQARQEKCVTSMNIDAKEQDRTNWKMDTIINDIDFAATH